MSADVLFGQAYFLRFDPKLWAAQQPYPPLGALYAAAYARRHGYRVGFFDAMLVSSEAEWARALDHERPAVAVLYEDSFNYLSKMCLLRMRQAALTMIDAARERGVPIIVAGSDASDHPAVYLARGAALVIAGEGEDTLVEVLDVMRGRRTADVAAIPGVCVLDGRGQVRRAPRRDFIRDLDSLPRPAWDLVDVAQYRAIWMRRHGYFSMNLATTRGCPYHCNWCAKPIYGQRYAARSPESVVDEMASLRAAYRPDHLWIADDIFGLKPGWIERFADLVEARGVRVPFRALLRADGVTPAIARALARAGCRTAWIGAESGSQRVLDAMEKGIRVEQIAEAARHLKASGVEVAFFLQFGYPGETLEDIHRTLQMVQACRPDDIGVSVSYPLPGTAFYDRVKTQLGAKQNWVDSDDLALMYRSTYPPDFYRRLHALVHAEFRSRRAWTACRTLAARPWRATPHALRDIAAGAVQRAKLPFIRRQVDRLAVGTTPAEVPALIPVLSRHAASLPSEQPR